MDSDLGGVERGYLALKGLGKELDESVREFRRGLGLYGRCDLCGKENNIYQDHDHDSGLIRGILCTKCNIGLGHFRDDPGLLALAIDYLKSWRHKHAALSPRDRKAYRYRVGRKGSMYSHSQPKPETILFTDVDPAEVRILAAAQRWDKEGQTLEYHGHRTKCLPGNDLPVRKHSKNGQQYGSQLPLF